MNQVYLGEPKEILKELGKIGIVGIALFLLFISPVLFTSPYTVLLFTVLIIISMMRIA